VDGSWQKITWVVLKLILGKSNVKIWNEANIKMASKKANLFIQQRIALLFKNFSLLKKNSDINHLEVDSLVEYDGKFAFFKSINEDSSNCVLKAYIKDDGSAQIAFGPSVNVPAVRLTTAVQSRKYIWFPREPWLNGIPSPSNFVLKRNQSLSLSLIRAPTFEAGFFPIIKPRTKASEFWELLGPEKVNWNRVWQQTQIKFMRPSLRALLLNIVWKNLYTGERHEKVTKQPSVCALCGTGRDYLIHFFFECCVAKAAWKLGMQLMCVPINKMPKLAIRSALIGDSDPIGIGPEKFALLRSHVLGALWAGRTNRMMNPDSPESHIDVLAQVIANTWDTAHTYHTYSKDRYEEWKAIRQLCREVVFALELSPEYLP
jgi:hypothetical protein